MCRADPSPQNPGAAPRPSHPADDHPTAPSRQLAVLRGACARPGWAESPSGRLGRRSCSGEAARSPVRRHKDLREPALQDGHVGGQRQGQSGGTREEVMEEGLVGAGGVTLAGVSHPPAGCEEKVPRSLPKEGWDGAQGKPRFP